MKVRYVNSKARVLDKLIKEVNEKEYPQRSIQSIFNSEVKRIYDLMYQARMDATYRLLINESITTYRYHAVNNDKTYDSCSINNAKLFTVTSAKAGVNFPPMHPSCRCSVSAIVNDKEIDLSKPIVDLVKYGHWLNEIIGKTLVPDNDNDTNNDTDNDIDDYINNFKYININGKMYKFDPNLTHNIAILPNGDIINGDRLNDKDRNCWI